MSPEYASAIYKGTVRHRRFHPKKHGFSYPVFMMYLDTKELDDIFSLSPFWSNKHWAIAYFKRTDFHIDKKNESDANTKKHHACQSLPSIDESIRNTVEHEIGFRPEGAIRMLVNLRYWGYSINPLSTYYCFDKSNKNVVAIVAEVKNTPWNERHAYVLSGENFSKKQHHTFKKSFHVSPFNPIDMEYKWASTTPDKALVIHLENWQEEVLIMDATMALRRMPRTSKRMHKILIHFPWMTVIILIAIYWQALKLYLKNVPIFQHPKK